MMPINRSLGFEVLGIVALAIWPFSGVFAQLEPDPWSQLYAPFVRDQRARPEYPWITDKAKQQKDVFARPDSNLTLIGLWPWGPCTAVAAREHYAFIGNGGLFQVFDLSNPGQPQILSEVFLGQSLAYDIKLKGDFAFVADGNLKVIDISDPARPQRVAALYLPETFAVRILISGDYAYVGSLGAIVSIVDISTPTSPFVKSTFRLSDDFVKNMAIYESYLYIKTEHPIAPIYIYDVSDLDNPRLAGFYAQRAYAFALSGSRLYLTADDSSFQVVDLTAPATPALISRIQVPFRGRAMSMKDSLAYVTGENPLLAVIDVTNPSAPSLRGTAYGSPGTSVSIAVAYPLVLANTGIGFWAIDVRPSDQPLPLTHFATGDAALKIQIVDNLAYMACLKAGLFVVDISNPQIPLFVSNISVGGSMHELAIIDSIAYLSGYPFGGTMPPELRIVNVAQPSCPELLSRLFAVPQRPQGGLYPTSIAVSGHHALVAYDAGFSIIDIADHRNPRLVKAIPTGRIAIDIAVTGNFACLAHAEKGLKIFDISHPESPREKFVVIGFASGVTTRNDTVFVALSAGLSIFKILSSGTLIKLGEIATPGSRSTVDIALQGNFAYMAYNESLVVLDISDPGHPRVVDYTITPAYANGVAAKFNEIYVAGSDWALQIYENNLITQIEERPLNHSLLSPQIFPNYPNPFNSSATIEYELPQAGKVELRVFNSLGEEVSQLVNAWQSAGRHRVTLDANNLPTGIYFCRLRFHDRWVLTQKMLILK